MGVGIWLASAAAGCLSRGIVHPLDTLRTVQMVSGGTLSMRGALHRVVSADGSRGLYRGFGVSLLLHAPAVSLYLSVYEQTRDSLRERAPGMHRVFAHAAAGLTAEAASAVVWAPMETIKQRAQLRTRSAGGSAAVLRDLMRREGPRALLSGYWVTLAVFGPYAALYFVVYERCRESARNANRDGQVAIGASAALAGAVAASATTPLDVVKTRLQTQGDAVAHGSRGRYSGTLHAVREIARTEGPRAFTKGIVARMLWIMPGTAITMTTFEFLKSFIVEGTEQARQSDGEVNSTESLQVEEGEMT